MNIMGKSSTSQNVSSQQNVTYIKLGTNLDLQISKNIKDSGMETRPAGSNGLWFCAILPMVLIIYSMLYRVSPLYNLIAVVSISLLVYSILFTLFMSISCLVVREPLYGGVLASTLISALYVYIYMGKGLAFSLLFTVLPGFIYNALLRKSLSTLPKTFTIGEAMLVQQGITLFVTMAAGQLFSDLGAPLDTDTFMILTVIYSFLSTVAGTVIVLYFLKREQRKWPVLLLILIAAALINLAEIHMALGYTALSIIFKYLTDNNRLMLVKCWMGLVILATIVLLVRTRSSKRADTVTRKVFHILASVVFLTGILWDLQLMNLAAGLGLGILVLIEALRKSKIEPISSALQAAFEVYKDEKDCGSLAMTPIYLYAGLACPLVLAPNDAATVELLSGILSIGVGDSAASWIGSRYGVTMWSGTNRTMEGTVANVLCQLATVYLLLILDVLHSTNALLRAGVAATASALVEAKTDQVDNLILPLVSILAFQATWIFS